METMKEENTQYEETLYKYNEEKGSNDEEIRKRLNKMDLQ